MIEADICANGLRRYTPDAQAAEEEQVRICTEFLRRCQPSPASELNWKNSCSSYGLKHHIEKWARKHGLGFYVSNGACLMAAVRLGLTVQPHRAGPNAWIGITRSSVFELVCGVGIQ